MSEMDRDGLAETPPAQRLPQSSHIPSSSEEYNESDATNANTPRVSQDQLGSAQTISGSKTSRAPAMNKACSSSVTDEEAPRHAQVEQHVKSITKPRPDSTGADIAMLDVQDQCTMAVKNAQGDFAAINQPTGHSFSHPPGTVAAEILSQMEMFRKTTQEQLDGLEATSHNIEKQIITLGKQMQSILKGQSRMLNEVDNLSKEVEEVETALKDKINDLEGDKLVMINHLEEMVRDWMDENILNRQPNSVTIISRRRRD